MEKQVGNLLTMDSELAKKNEDLQKNVNTLVAKDNEFTKTISSMMTKNDKIDSGSNNASGLKIAGSQRSVPNELVDK